MTPVDLEVSRRSTESVQVRIHGEPTVEKQIQIANKDFVSALEQAIRDCRLFARVTRGGGGYALDVRITGYNPPRTGANMTATMTTHWKLTRLSDRSVLFEDFVKQSHTCTIGDAFVGATRWRMANEGVARDTIAEGIRRLSGAPLWFAPGPGDAREGTKGNAAGRDVPGQPRGGAR
jgi:hypothetical protein